MAGKELALIDEENMAGDDADNRAQVRVWLRLLACTSLIGTELRRQFREEFDFTMPRFDVLAQLDREPVGLVLGELPKRLMVTAGNLTPIVDRLVEDGFITRSPSPLDRRVQIVCMTAEGQEGVQADGEKARPLAGFAAGRVSESAARRIGQGTRRPEERREACDGAGPRLISSGAVCILPHRDPRCRESSRRRAARPFGSCRSHLPGFRRAGLR